MSAENKSAGLQPGAEGKANFIADSTKPVKPEMDLQSWSELGKPSRVERKPKRTWKRRAGK